MKKNVSIIILAAGKGSRMHATLPKVLHTLSGKEMLFYSLQEAQKISDDIHVVLYHQANMIQNKMQEYFSDCSIHYHIQDHENFPGTGGAVMGIEPKYQKVLLLNGDMPLIQAQELQKLLLDDPSKKQTALTLSILELACADGYGRVVIQDQKVQQIIEQKDCTPAQQNIRTANAGVYCFDADFLKKYLPKLTNTNAQKEYYITQLIEFAVADGFEVIPVQVKEENFKGVNTKYELADAEMIHQNRIKKGFLEAGVTMRLPETIFIEYGVDIKGESVIESGVSLLNESVIINSHIKTNSVIDNALIQDSDVGPMAHIRPLSVITSTHIGNFVEVKKAALTGVKAGHLSYLGDAVIDEGTNVGAGTITCNYDGKTKSQTHIGKNVFIGSDTQLIAPVSIADDVMIAAGSTITSDVKSGDLALSRTKQKTIKGFFYKFFQNKQN